MEFKHLAKGYKLIECENLEIAASCEANFEEGECTNSEFYHPSNILVYIEQGILEIEFENKYYRFTKGQICFVRKYTHIRVSKRFSKEITQAKTYAFMMPDKFLRRIITNFKFDKTLNPIGNRIIELNPTYELLDIITNIQTAVNQLQAIDTVMLETKIMTGLRAIINSNPNIAVLFKEFTLAERVDLHLFMNLNFTRKASLKTLAELSGRSLSTFEREFKLIFNTTPHKWIIKKRLLLSQNLLNDHTKRISDVFYEVGFEDLPHFSRAFKKEFGITPSEYRKLSVHTTLLTQTD
jgi:AraC-like DNA-binding protein